MVSWLTQQPALIVELVEEVLHSAKLERKFLLIHRVNNLCPNNDLLSELSAMQVHSVPKQQCGEG